ncbi:hypothetical protein [Tateyamaria sp.]|uniref:hypothetical protein n=1 Tax=Tateyamaria sp. TaxID=1929288 RepID=UPI00329B75E1
MNMTSSSALLASLIVLSSCGTQVPNLTLSDEDQLFVEDVHLAIRCELIQAVHEANIQANALESFHSKTVDFFESWGVKYTLTLRVVENSSANISLSGTSDTSPNPGDTVATVGLGLGGSAKATRTEIDQSFNTVKVYSNEEFCSDAVDNKISPSGGDLGIGSWMRTRLALVDQDLIGPISEKESFTYQVQFDVARTGSISPTFTFIQRQLSSAAVPLSGGRSTAHSVLVTFGPADPSRAKLAEEAAQVHNARIIGAAIEP